MEEQETFQCIVQYLIKEFGPVAILFFGSRQREDHSEKSDWDFYLIVRNGDRSYDHASATQKASTDLAKEIDVLWATIDGFLESYLDPQGFAFQAKMGDVVWPDKYSLLCDFLHHRKELRH